MCSVKCAIINFKLQNIDFHRLNPCWFNQAERFKPHLHNASLFLFHLSFESLLPFHLSFLTEVNRNSKRAEASLESTHTYLQAVHGKSQVMLKLFGAVCL